MKTNGATLVVSSSSYSELFLPYIVDYLTHLGNPRVRHWIADHLSRRNNLFRERIAVAVAPVLLALAAPAHADADVALQPAVAAQEGTEVRHISGDLVGMVTRVDRDHLVVKTDRHEAKLPKSSFTPHEGRLLIALTREQLNASVESTLARADEQIVAGASVRGTRGAMVGTIESLGENFVTIKLASGALLRIPNSGIAPSAGGPVVGASAAELEAAAARAQ